MQSMGSRSPSEGFGSADEGSGPRTPCGRPSPEPVPGRGDSIKREPIRFRNRFWGRKSFPQLVLGRNPSISRETSASQNRFREGWGAPMGPPGVPGPPTTGSGRAVFKRGETNPARNPFRAGKPPQNPPRSPGYYSIEKLPAPATGSGSPDVRTPGLPEPQIAPVPTKSRGRATRPPPGPDRPARLSQTACYSQQQSSPRA